MVKMLKKRRLAYLDVNEKVNKKENYMSVEVWKLIRDEAKELVDNEPMLASFFHSTILKHKNLGGALSYILANKLATATMPAITRSGSRTLFNTAFIFKRLSRSAKLSCYSLSMA